jgi:hypothetical protein
VKPALLVLEIVQLQIEAEALNVLSSEEQKEGWEPVFDGRTLRQWTGSDGAAKPDGWTVEDGARVTEGSNVRQTEELCSSLLRRRMASPAAEPGIAPRLE